MKDLLKQALRKVHDLSMDMKIPFLKKATP